MGDLRRVALGLVVAIGVWALPFTATQAVTSDNGWTQEDNNGYGNDGIFYGQSPDCYPRCTSWPLNQVIFSAEDYNVPFHGEEANAVSRWNNARRYAAQPYTNINDGLGADAEIHGVYGNPGGNNPNLCARTGWSWYSAPAGARAQRYFYRTLIIYNSAKQWSIGSPQKGKCDMGVIATHEFGHAFGLGHTTQSNQLMYPIPTQFTPQSRDICGFSRTYVQIAC